MAESALKQAMRERDEYLAKLKHCLTAGETTARLVEEAKTERDEARAQSQKEAERGDALSTALINLNLDLDEARAEAGRLREALRKELPFSQGGGCWYCYIGSEADSELMHPDRDNAWGGDQKCLLHDHYAEARAALDAGVELGQELRGCCHAHPDNGSDLAVKERERA